MRSSLAAFGVLVVACSRAPATLRPELEAGVRVGAGLYECRIVPTSSGTGIVGDLALGRVVGDPREHLVVVGISGYELRDPVTLELRDTTAFRRECLSLRAVDVDGDGAFEFVTLPADAVFDSGGRELRCEPTDGSVNGESPLRVGWEQSHYHVATSDGSERRVAALRSSDVKERDAKWLVDADGDGTQELVVVDGKSLSTRRVDGTPLRACQPPGGGYVNALLRVEQYGTPPREAWLVGHYIHDGPDDGQKWELYALDAHTHLGRVTEEALDPYVGSQRLEGSAERWVKLLEWKQQAPVAGYAFVRQVVRVFDAERNTIFEEVVAPRDEEPVRGEAGDVVPLSSPAGAFIAAYGTTLRVYVPAKER